MNIVTPKSINPEQYPVMVDVHGDPDNITAVGESAGESR